MGKNSRRRLGFCMSEGDFFQRQNMPAKRETYWLECGLVPRVAGMSPSESPIVEDNEEEK